MNNVNLAGLEWSVERQNRGMLLRCLGPNHLTWGMRVQIQTLGRRLEQEGLGKQVGAWHVFVKDEPALFWMILTDGASH